LIKRVERHIIELAPLISVRPFRVQLFQYLQQHRQLVEQRYLDRREGEAKYSSHNYLNLDDSRRFPDRESMHKAVLRVSSSELARLVLLVGDHPSLNTHGRKPAAPPQLQLAVFLNRMAHAGSINTIAHTFDIPRKVSSIYRL
jgi:hypothetical protein